MSSIRESIAVDSAISRIISVMQDNFATELADAEIAVTGLPLGAPGDSAYFTVGSRELLDQVLSNNAVTAFVYQAAPTEIEENTTGSGTEHGAWQSFEVEIVLAFNTAVWTPIEYNGKTLTLSDQMTLRAHRYNAGVINTIRKHACDVTNIWEVEKVSDFAGAVEFSPEQQPLRGFATSVWRIYQSVLVYNTGN